MLPLELALQARQQSGDALMQPCWRCMRPACLIEAQAIAEHQQHMLAMQLQTLRTFLHTHINIRHSSLQHTTT
jgi:hypothetical protein